MDSSAKTDAEMQASPPQAKSAYVKPALVRLGSFQDLTMNVGQRGASDGGRDSRRNRTRS